MRISAQLTSDFMGACGTADAWAADWTNSPAAIKTSARVRSMRMYRFGAVIRAKACLPLLACKSP